MIAEEKDDFFILLYKATVIQMKENTDIDLKMWS
jgi:hypothetical protein